MPTDPAPGTDSQRPDLATVRTSYQVASEDVIKYHPHLGGVIPIPVAEARMTRTEGELLNEMTRARGIDGLLDFKNIHDRAFDESARRYPDTALPEHVDATNARQWQGNDGHRDAFRHAYWNSLMASEYGQDWARAFGTAHEGLPDNPANREAMDLYNNEVGRKVAAEHPGASPDALAGFIASAVQDGRMVVLDKNGELAWSDRVAIGEHGLAPSESIDPHLGTPKPVAPGARTSSDFGSLGPAMQQGTLYGIPAGDSAANHRYALYQSVSGHIDTLDQQLGRQSDQNSACMKASLTTLAAANGFERVDHVLLSKTGGEVQAGQHVFIVQGDPSNPAHLRAHTPTEQAVNTQVEASFRELAQLDQRQLLQNTQAMSQQHDVPMQGARTMGA